MNLFAFITSCGLLSFHVSWFQGFHVTFERPSIERLVPHTQLGMSTQAFRVSWNQAECQLQHSQRVNSCIVSPARRRQGYHTVEYDPFIKSQLASMQLTLGPYVVQIWSQIYANLVSNIKCKFGQIYGANFVLNS